MKLLPAGIAILFLLPVIAASGQLRVNPGKRSILSREGGGTIWKQESPSSPATESSPAKKEHLAPYHITFHFDTAPYEVLFNGTDTSYSGGDLYWSGPATAEIYMDPGYYDLLFFFQVYNYPAYVFKKNFHVYKDTDTTILMSSATHTLTLDLYDENGSLITAQNLDGDDYGVIFGFPGGYSVPYRGMLIIGWGVPYAKFTDVTPDIRITTGRSAVKKNTETSDHQVHRYVTSYPVQEGISGDRVLANDPAGYGQYPLVFYPSASVTDPYWGFSFGYLANDQLGNMDYLVVGLANNEYPSKPVDTLRLFSSLVAQDSAQAVLVSGTAHWENSPLNITVPNQYTDSWLSYITPDKDLVLGATGTFPPSSGDYRAGDGNRVSFGNAAPYFTDWFLNTSTRIDVFENFMGQANEFRMQDQSKSTYEIRKGTQLLIRDTVRTPEIHYPVSVPGTYSLILNDSNYRLMGKPGFAQATCTFDLSKPDRNPPVITSFRVMKTDSISPELIHGYDASAAFSAGDFTIRPAPLSRLFHGLQAVRLFFKDYDGSSWSEIPVNVQPALFDSLMGNYYRADLLPVMNQFPDSAWVDLRLELDDSTGNSTVHTLHPAFLVRDALVTVPGQPDRASLGCYPDPVRDILHWKSSPDPATVSIVTPEGRLVMSVAGAHSIDVSGLPAGIYFLKASGAKGTGRFFTKFVKL